MAQANPTSGEERIADELHLKLGVLVSPRTVGRLPPDPTVPLGAAGDGPSSGRPLCGIMRTRSWRVLRFELERAFKVCGVAIALYLFCT